MSTEQVVRALQLQSRWGTQLGSPFIGALMAEAAKDVEAGGAVAALIGDWPGDPLEDALAARFSGVLQAAVFESRAPELAREYPMFRPDWSIERIWPLALAFLEREQDWVRDFLRMPPQTNETRRCIAFLPAFLQLARLGPLHLLELGASAGLNQIWDRYAYEPGPWRWGADNGVTIRSVWSGPAPDLDAPVHVASREGCDRGPLDVNSDSDMMRLRAYIWGDQADRLARLDGAIALARAANVRIDKADAGEWIEAKLAAPLREGVTVVYHSVFWQYVAPPTRERIRAAVTSAAARADETHCLAWVRYEPNLALALEGPVEAFSVQVKLWPGEETRVVARTDGHATKVEAF